MCSLHQELFPPHPLVLSCAHDHALGDSPFRERGFRCSFSDRILARMALFFFTNYLGSPSLHLLPPLFGPVPRRGVTGLQTGFRSAEAIITSLLVSTLRLGRATRNPRGDAEMPNEEADGAKDHRLDAVRWLIQRPAVKDVKAMRTVLPKRILGSRQLLDKRPNLWPVNMM